jgi:hypothetical protein
MRGKFVSGHQQDATLLLRMQNVNAKDKVVHMFEETHVAKSGKAYPFDVHAPNKCQLSVYSYACMAFIGPSKHVTDNAGQSILIMVSWFPLHKQLPSTRYYIGHAYVVLRVDSGGIHFETLSADWLSLLEVFRGFPRYLQKNVLQTDQS